MTKRALPLLAALLFATAAFAADAPKKPVKQVEAKTVCMINEHAMGAPQMAVEVNGKTYYGCCEGCKNALKNDASRRVAVDPVTGKDVDKADAVIGAQEDGKVVYFASVANLDKYNAELASVTAGKQ